MDDTVANVTQRRSYDVEYQSRIEPRVSLPRGSRGSLGNIGSSRTLRITSELGGTTGISPEMSHEAASSISENRQREKKDLQDLNDRLGAYIDRVRFLEAQNRKLVEELEGVRSRWGKGTAAIKAEYDEELTEARKLIDETANDKAKSDVMLERLELDLSDMRCDLEEAMTLRAADKEKLDDYLTKFSDAQTETEQLCRRLACIQAEYKRYSGDQDRLKQETTEIKNNWDKETLDRYDLQNQTQTLTEAIMFMKRVHDQEVKELDALMPKDTPQTNREYFRNELELALADIRIEYDAIAEQTKNDMEAWYNMKLQEVSNASKCDTIATTFQKEETNRLRDQLANGRDKLDALEDKNNVLAKQLQELYRAVEDDQQQYETELNERDAQIKQMKSEVNSLTMELQALMETKQSLDAEIAIYRRMLECEENRAGLKTLVEQAVKTHNIGQTNQIEVAKSMRGEVSQKTTFQRSAKGNISIADIHEEGKFITLENTHRQRDEMIGEWQLLRYIDGKREHSFKFPKHLALKAGKSIKVFAKGQAGALASAETLYLTDSTTWGKGKNARTVLCDKDGEERATYVQKAPDAQT